MKYAVMRRSSYEREENENEIVFHYHFMKIFQVKNKNALYFR